MISIIGAFIFSLVAIMTVLVACGLPLGEFTMGGKYKVLPKNLRIMALFSILIQVFAILTILQAGGIIELMFSENATKYICLFFAIYLTLNSIMNFFSNSKKEKYFITPLSVIAAVCFWITFINM